MFIESNALRQPVAVQLARQLALTDWLERVSLPPNTVNVDYNTEQDHTSPNANYWANDIGSITIGLVSASSHFAKSDF